MEDRPSTLAPSGGSMAAAVRGYDWAATPVGPIQGWPSELRTAVSLVLESRFPMALLWGPDLVTFYNDAFRPILRNKPEALGRDYRLVWAEAWDVIAPIADRALTGEASYFENLPLTIAYGGEVEQAWCTFCLSPVRMADGSVGGVVKTLVETTAAVRASEEADVLRDELAHRLKNTMAMVQSIAQRTLRGVTDRDAVKAFEKRVIALGHAHDVLGRGSWQNASLGDLAQGLLAMHGERFELSGPEMALGASATLRLSLILHELATNAAKYGALASPDGVVALHWHIDQAERGEMLVLCWREKNGPPVVAPTRTGFGSRLIDMGLMGTGKVERRYPETGVEVDLRVPVVDLAER